MGNTKTISLIPAGLILSPAILLAAAQSPSRDAISASAHPVPVNVTVTDDLGRTVTDLSPGSFQIFEDKVPQSIVGFRRDDSPLSIGIVFDTSASVENTMERSQLAVAALFGTTSPDDEAFLVEFGDRPQLMTPMTHNLKEIQNRLADAIPSGAYGSAGWN